MLEAADVLGDTEAAEREAWRQYEEGKRDLAALHAQIAAIALQMREIGTTVARKGDVELTIVVLDPIVLKRWADQLVALGRPKQD